MGGRGKPEVDTTPTRSVPTHLFLPGVSYPVHQHTRRQHRLRQSPIPLFLNRRKICTKHHRPHDVETKIRAHNARIPHFAPTSIFRLDRLTEAFDNINYIRLAGFQRLGREHRADPSPPHSVHLAIRLSEATIRPGGDVKRLIPFAFLDVGGAGAIYCAEG